MTRKRPVEITEERIQTFLDALADAQTVQKACMLANISKSGIYDYLKAHPDLKERWERAYETGTEKLEAEMIRRAVEGTSKPVYQGGKKVGHVQEYSDTLLIFALKARRPETYRERYELSGKNGGALVVEIVRHGDTSAPDASDKAAG